MKILLDETFLCIAKQGAQEADRQLAKSNFAPLKSLPDASEVDGKTESDWHGRALTPVCSAFRNEFCF